MSEEKITPEDRLKNVDGLIEDAISALYDISAWMKEGDLDQAQAARESVGEALYNIEEWLDDAADEVES